jgi:hypothetical protein
MHTQELKRILTHNPKGLPILFLYSLWEGSDTGARKACFRLPSYLEFLHGVVP